MSQPAAPTAWVCSVCGYVHRGTAAPAACPVCGVAAELFGAGEPGDAGAATAPTQWRCVVCGYVHHGPTPPAACPVCGAAADSFEPYSSAAPAPAAAAAAAGKGAAPRLVVVGAGAAGVAAAEAARKSAADCRILLLSREPDPPYYRLNLTRYLAGDVGGEQLDLRPASWYEDNGIELRCGVEAVRLDLAAAQVETAAGERLEFDGLVLAAGAVPFVPPLPGVERANVLALRSRADADAILAAAPPGAECVCLGGGLLGLETAGALARRGVRVTVVEGADWLLPRQLTPRAGQLLAAHLESLGIALRTGARTGELTGDERVRGVRLADGTSLAADVVVVATGVRPDLSLARQAGLETNVGVLVDDRLRSSREGVYAAGDVAEHRQVCYGTWGPAQYQGTIAGINAAGGFAEFAGMAPSNTLKVLDVRVFSIGTVRPRDSGDLMVEGDMGASYGGFLFREERLAGAVLLGDTTLALTLRVAIEGGQDLSALLRTRPAVQQVVDWFAAAH